MFRSKYCTATFIAAAVISYIVIPEGILFTSDAILGILFMITFSLTVTCVVRNVKERIVLEKTYKGSALGAIATAVGLGALHTCTVGMPVCGASIGLGILSQILPGVFINVLSDYSRIIIIFSIVLQIASLYFMNCFKMIEFR